MRERLERRRDELAAELKSGQDMLAELDARRTDLQQTLLRISGALQVLTELIDADAGDAPPAGVPAGGPNAAAGNPGSVPGLDGDAVAVAPA